MNQDIRNQKIDLSEIFSLYKRHWWWFAISIIVCVGIAYAYNKFTKPIYQISAKVLIASDEGGGMGGSLMKNLSFLGESSSETDDEIEIIGSHTILIKAIKELKLNRSYEVKTGIIRSKTCYNDSPVEINAPESLLDTLSVSLKFSIQVNENNKIDIKVKKGMFKTVAEVKNASSFPISVKTDYGIFSVSKTKHFKDNKKYDITAYVSSYDGLAEDLAEEIGINATSKKSNSIYISTRSSDVKMTKDLINTIINLYNERGVEVKNEIAQKTKSFINERLNILYSNLSNSEANIEQFKKANNFVDLELEAQYQTTKKGSLESKLLETETEASIMRMIYEFMKSPQNNYALIPFTSGAGEGLSSAISSYNSLILQYIKLQNNAKVDNTILKNLMKEIEALRKNVIESVSKGIESNSIALNEIKAKSNNSISKLDEIPRQEKEFIDLKRTQSVQNYLYSFLLQKKEENELVLAAAIPKGQIIDRAYSSSLPVAPNKMLILFGALIIGLALPIIILYTIDLFRTKFFNIDDLTKLTNTPVLGEICHNSRSSNIVVREGKTTPIVELFRLIRNNIQFMLPKVSGNVILITSSVSGEGKSFVSANIAASLSLIENKKVIIVGMDIRSPQLSKIFEVKAVPGLTNYLSSTNVELNDVIQKSNLNDLDIIVAGPIPPNPSELLLSSRVNELISKLESIYDYIIIDSAPIAMVSDTFSLTKYADMCLYITRSGYTKKQFIKYFNGVVDKKQLTNVAIILNDTDTKLSHGYGYGYGKKDIDDSES